VVEANCLAAEAPGVRAGLQRGLRRRGEPAADRRAAGGAARARDPARHAPSRAGDVPHTLADIDRAKRLLGYTPLVHFDEGLRRTLDYFRRTV
jgi:nucleoside-diphosphate-sugar epimerase